LPQNLVVVDIGDRGCVSWFVGKEFRFITTWFGMILEDAVYADTEQL
jgi:hypothetical protein